MIYGAKRFGIKQLRTCQWIMNSSVFQIMNSADKKERGIEDEEEETEKERLKGIVTQLKREMESQESNFKEFKQKISQAR